MSGTAPPPSFGPWTPAQVRAAIHVIAITDDLRDGVDGLVARCMAAARGGATMVQVRFKALSSRDLLRVTRALVGALHIPVVVNDRLDIALAASAAGVHLGMHDLPVGIARAISTRASSSPFLIGASLTAAADIPEVAGADYVGVGPVLATPSKTDAAPALGVAGAAELARRAALPAVAIGGVDATNTEALIAAGFDGVSVIRAVLSTDDPHDAARQLAERVHAVRAHRETATPWVA